MVKAAAASDVVVTSYALLRLDAAEYRETRWSALVLDEAQFVKNPQSQTHRAAAELGAPVTFAITGTPLENGLTDLGRCSTSPLPACCRPGRGSATTT